MSPVMGTRAAGIISFTNPFSTIYADFTGFFAHGTEYAGFCATMYREDTHCIFETTLAPSCLPAPLSRQQKRKARVTIVVGIFCKDAVVIASDSQTSDMATTTNRKDTDKIHRLKFRSGEAVLVAEAGDAVASRRAIEILTGLLAQADLDDYRKPLELAEQAVSQTKASVAKLNNWKFGGQQSIQHWRENEAALMLAHFYQGKPYLWTLHFSKGIGMKWDSNTCIGCGSTVGQFILSRAPQKMELHQAMITAIYTVEEVKRVDSFCGGPTKIGFVLLEGDSAVVKKGLSSEELIKSTVESIAKYDDKLRSLWADYMVQIMRDALRE